MTIGLRNAGWCASSAGCIARTTIRGAWRTTTSTSPIRFATCCFPRCAAIPRISLVRTQAITLAITPRRDRRGALEQFPETGAVAVAAALDDFLEAQVGRLEQGLGSFHAQVLDMRDRRYAVVGAEMAQQAALARAAMFGKLRHAHFAMQLVHQEVLGLFRQ